MIVKWRPDPFLTLPQLTVAALSVHVAPSKGLLSTATHDFEMPDTIHF